MSWNGMSSATGWIVADGYRAGAVIDSIRANFKKEARNRTSLDLKELIGEASS